MPAFDLDQLRTFAAVVEAGSLTAAAPRVFRSQSAVSEQIRKLELQAGQALLTRGKAGVAPTEAGKRLLAYAHRMLALGDEAWRALRGESLAGELRLAVTDYYRPGELTRLLARLADSYPALRLRVDVLKSDAIAAAYEAGEIDVALTMRLSGQRAPAGARGTRVHEEGLAWMAAPHRAPVAGEPLRLVLLPDGCSLHQYVVALLARRRVPYTLAHVASGVAGLQSAVAAGLGVGCLNLSARVDGIAPLPAGHGLPALPSAAFWLLPPRPGEAAFVTRAREVVATHLVA